MTKEKGSFWIDVFYLLGWVALFLTLGMLIVVACNASAQEHPPYDRDEWGDWRSTGDHGPKGCRWDSRSAALRDAGAAEPNQLIVRDDPGKPCRVLSVTFFNQYKGPTLVCQAK